MGSELEKLEEYIGKLLNNYSALKKSYQALQSQFLEREKRIGELEQQLSSLGTDHGEISRRVNGLIDMIEEWEKGDMNPFEPEGLSDGRHDETSGYQDLSAQEQVDRSSREEEESPESRQQNLFSME